MTDPSRDERRPDDAREPNDAEAETRREDDDAAEPPAHREDATRDADDARTPTAEDGDAESAAAEQPAAPQRPPFSGIFHRIGALAIDLVALYLITHFLHEVAREVLLQFNPWLPWIGQLGGVLYFTLLNGPLGKGRTWGKMVLHLRVVDRSGRTLDWPRAIPRGLVQSCLLFSMLNMGKLGLAIPADAVVAAHMLLLIVAPLARTVLLVSWLSLVIHPYRRALHDLLAGSFVTYEPIPDAFHERMREAPDAFAERRIYWHSRILLVCAVLIGATLLMRPVKVLLDPGEVIEMMQRREQLESRVDMAGFHVRMAAYPSVEMRQAFRRGVEMQQQSYRQSIERAGRTDTALPDSLTTDSMRRFYPDGESLFVALYKRTGALTTATVQSRDVRDMLLELRREMWRDWQEERAAAIEEGGDPPPRARRFHGLLIEPFDLLFEAPIAPALDQFLPSKSKPRALVSGPADPAAGPLDIEPFDLEALMDRIRREQQQAAAGEGGAPDAEPPMEPIATPGVTPASPAKPMREVGEPIGD